MKKDLNACLVARKRLEVMCSIIGKEKEIMAAELARKNYELSELEEHVNDLRAQNKTLLQKVKEFAADHEDKLGKGKGILERNAADLQGKGKVEGNAADLQVRNKALSEQLLRSLDAYRLIKRKLRNTQEEALVMRENMEKMSEKVGAGLQHVRAMKQQIATQSEDDKLVFFKEGTAKVEHVFECLEMMVSKHVERKE
ncbi:hypothetical protein POM88_035107 [Heracleum sosnowskyi]|uniref:Uncharacterized protein n=1 Tax=Heracleum sosnowskyi TaxID=360622 RepID=A0AAD8MB75_9APIA|nr:hypothetical protein POM88_035107 [Heracleum sosnowskyi]